MPSRKLSLVFTIFLFFNYGLSTQDSTIIIPMLTVTSPGWALGEEAHSFSNLDHELLAFRYYGQEPALLLENEPSITVYTDAGSGLGYAYFRLRGIDQTRLNFTLDGVPLNEPEDQGFYFNNYVDLLSSVRDLQLQRGVNIGVNGTAAFGGAVQLRSPGLGGPEFMEVSAGYGSFASYRASVAASQKLGQAGWEIYGRATTLGSDGFKENSRHRGTSAFLQTGIAGERHIFKATLFGGNQRNDMAWLGVPLAILEENPRANFNAEQEQDDFTTALGKLQYTWLASDKIAWSSSLYQGYQNGNYDFDLNNFLGEPSTEELYNYAFRYHLTGLLSNVEYRHAGWQLNAGIHGNTYQREHLGSERSFGELYVNEGRKREASLFARAQRRMDRLTLSAATQFRSSRFGYEGNGRLEPLNYDFLNYQGSATYALSSDEQFYYGFGSVGREPTRNDLFGGNDDPLVNEDGSVQLFTVDAERVFDHELGFRRQGKSIDFDVNLFYLRFQDEIVLSGQFGPNGLPLRAGVATSYRAGLEWQVNVRLSQNWAYRQNGAWTRARITQDEVSFQPVLTPPFLLRQGVVYEKNEFNGGLNANYQRGAFIDFANTSELENFLTFDLYGGYQTGRFNFRLFLNNLTDVGYRTNGQLDVFGQPTFHQRAGLNAHFSVTYRMGHE